MEDAFLPLFASAIPLSFAFSLLFPSYDAGPPNFQPPFLLSPTIILAVSQIPLVLCSLYELAENIPFFGSSFLLMDSYGNPSHLLRLSISV